MVVSALFTIRGGKLLIFIEVSTKDLWKAKFFFKVLRASFYIKPQYANPAIAIFVSSQEWIRR